MRISRRVTNPIFLEDEGHNWKPRRNGLGKTVLMVLVLLSLAGLALLLAG